MKKILSLLFLCFILVACSNNDSNDQSEEANEPVTKIIHECQCATNEESDVTKAEQENEDEEETDETMQNDFEQETEEESDAILQNDDLNQENESNSHETIYTVVAGDTLTRIAEKFGVTLAQIQSWNHLISADDLYVGQVLSILSGTNHVSSTPEINPGTMSIAEETINYILNGQEEKRESERLNWNETFLRQLNIAEFYQEYLDEGGEAGSIESFAQHLTLNAPILENWEELFKANFYQAHGIEIIRVASLGGGRYRAYIEENSVGVPEVIVSSRTGYYSR